MTQSAADFGVMATTRRQTPRCCEHLQLIGPREMFDGRGFEQASIQKTSAQVSQGRWASLASAEVVAGALVVVEEVLQADRVRLPEPAGHHLIVQICLSPG